MLNVSLFPALRALPQRVVHEHERGHRLDHRHGARQHAGIVTATALERGVVKGFINRVLRLHDGGDGLERGAEENRFAVRDAALDAAGTVRGGENFSVLRAKGVVVLQTGQQNSSKTVAALETFARGQAQHGLGEIGFELVEHRFAPAGGHAARNTFDNAANGVARVAHFFDEPDHFLRRLRVGTADDVGFYFFELDLFRINVTDDFLHLLDVGENFHAKFLAQNLFRNRAGGHAANGLASAGTSAALPGADAVFGEVSVVGMGRTKLVLHLVVSLGTRVLVFDPETNRRAEREAVGGKAGHDLHRVGFLARGDDFGLTGPAAVEIRLDVGLGKFQARRTAVHDDAHAAAMRFAPRREAEGLSKAACHAVSVRKIRRAVKSP